MIRCMLIVAIGVTFAPARAEETSPLHDAVSRMFEAGLGPKRSATAAKLAYEEATRLSPNNAKITHAWGLIQLQRTNRDEARAAFRKSIQQVPASSSPRRALIWTLVSISKTRTEGLKQAEEWARVLADDSTELSRDERLDSAQWLSEILSSLRATSIGKTKRKLIDDAERRIVPILGHAALTESWVKGRLAVQERKANANKSEEERAALAKQKAEKKSKETIARIESRLEHIRKSQVKSELDKNDLREAVLESLAMVAGELGRLERAHQVFTKQAEVAHASILETLRRITAFNLRNQGRQRAQQSIEATSLQQELFAAQVRHREIIANADGLVVRAQNLIAYRNRLAANLDEQTGKIAQQQQQMGDWTHRLKSRKRKIGREKEKPRRPPKVTLREIAPFDIDTERFLLLEAIAKDTP